MPELPEVETIVRKLRTVLPGKTITAIKALHTKTWQGPDSSGFHDYQVKDVSRRAKVIRIHLVSPKENQSANLLIHLKMTGQLIYTDPRQRLGGGHPTADWVNQLPSKHTRLVFELSDEAKLFFNDQRLFGWIKPLTDEEVDRAFSLLAPDVIDDQVTPEYLYPLFQRRSQAIKQVIMDNTVMSGLGNIYACDALNMAKINPFRPAKSLTLIEVESLLQAAKEVLRQGIELGGTTFDGKYVDTDGFAGHYQTRVRVYGREGKACHNCGGTIVKTQLGGRGTYYCPECQI